MTDDAIRFDTPLYTVTEAARALGVPTATFHTWVRGYERVRRDGLRHSYGPIVSSLVNGSGPTIPFVGLAEGMVLAAIRQADVPLQRVRPALDVLRREMGVAHALASQRLFTDGAELLFDYADSAEDPGDAQAVRELVVIRSGQRVLSDVIQGYLHRITYDSGDGYARLIRLPAYEHAEVIADPARSFGQPIFLHGGSKVSDVLDRFQAGEDVGTLAMEFGVPALEIEDALRAASRRAA